MMSDNVNLLLLSKNEYPVFNSLRFRASNSAFLSRTAGTPTSRTTWTGSFWVKRGLLTSVSKSVFGAMPTNGSAPYDYVSFSGIATDALDFYFASNAGGLQTTALFRDPAAWYHVVVVADTTQSQTSATASNSRLRLFVNGAQITNFTTATMPAQNTQSAAWNVSGTQNNIGVYNNGINLFGDMLLAEFNFIDGQALAASYFGQTDSATGVWVAKKYAGTYGNNGFYLKFSDASAATAAAIGKDSSGNGNNWTPSGISVTSGGTFDQMTDTPTNNYAVMNPLENSQFTLSNGNLTYSRSGAGSNIYGSFGNFYMSSGKWYWEVTATTASGTNNHNIGLARASITPGTTNNWTPSTWFWFNGGEYGFDGVYASSGVPWQTNNDVTMHAYDADTGKYWLGKNGTWNGSGNPAAGTNPVATITNSTTDPVRFAVGNTNNGGTFQDDINFGQRAFSYTAPSGFKALNTANLPTPSIKKGSLFFDATTRTGTGASASVSTLGFQPDFVWIKSRSNSTAHNLFNSVIGATKGIQSTGPNAQYTDANSLTAFNANGYSLGSDASSRGVNINTNTYVDWAWRESTTAGLDILTWTGNGTGARTINHGLGVTPEFMMLRGTDARAWACWFNSMTSAAYYMDLGTYAAEAVDTTMFDSTAPTSTTFRVGSYNNINTVTYVGYFFSSVAGFSKIGSYTGNASTDGPFTFCGFRPRLVIIKDVTTANLGWRLYDSVREASNEMGGGLEAASTAAESYAVSVRALDFLSNGFKIRVSASGLNGSGVKFAYIAFAENSFKYARAR